MASAFSHAIAALALRAGVPDERDTWTLTGLGVLCAVLPDADVVGFRFGVAYGDLWGHRGMTHSLLFAAAISAGLVRLFYWDHHAAPKTRLFLFLFACGASHGVLDAMTTGGLGVAFFSPFVTKRFFFDFHPILVSPIGVKEFFTHRGLLILKSEIKWIWVPSVLVSAVLDILRRALFRRA